METFIFGKDIKTWCGFLIVMDTISVIESALYLPGSYGIFLIEHILIVVVNLLAIAILLWLLKSKKRIAFKCYLLLFAFTAIVKCALGGPMLFVIPGVLNPLITYLILQKYWVFME